MQKTDIQVSSDFKEHVLLLMWAFAELKNGINSFFI